MIKRFFTIFMCLVFLSSFFIENLIARETKTSSRTQEPKKKWVKSKDGLKALMELSKDRAKMAEEYDTETDNYNNALKAIDKDSLPEGLSAEDVRNKLGEPVIVLSEPDGERTRWVYKNGAADYSSSEKVYLFFDKNEKLINWVIPPAKN